jgi:hypothetical protein
LRPAEREYPLRELLNALRYLVRYGIAWRAMPNDFPPWHAVSKSVLHVNGPDGTPRHLTVDHVIAATGYRFNVRSLPFLSQRLISELRCVQQAPSLSPSFESSIPGLYFTGLEGVMYFCEGWV